MHDPALPDLAPATAPDAATAERLGRAIVEVFEHLETLPDKVGWTCRQISGRLGAGADPVLAQGCLALADLIDADPSAFDLHPYHNRQHYCEVALTGYYLCLAAGTTVHEMQWVLLAALMHDVVHSGRTQASFQLERASVRRAEPVLKAVRLDDDAIARLAVLVLCTDVAIGTRFVCDALRASGEGAPMPVAPAEAPELALLTRDPSLLRLAQLLCEADILPSIGLTFAHSMRLQRRLSLEWQRPLGDHDKLEFIDTVLACGIVGAFFLPNVLAARRTLLERLRARAPV